MNNFKMQWVCPLCNQIWYWDNLMWGTKPEYVGKMPSRTLLFCGKDAVNNSHICNPPWDIELFKIIPSCCICGEASEVKICNSCQEVLKHGFN